MRFLIEVVADDTADAVPLIREVAALLKKGRVVSGRTVNHCIGNYRVIVHDDESKQSVPEAPKSAVTKRKKRA